MTTTDEHVKRVGPVLRGVDGELCDAVINAIEDDNPDAEVEVDDQGSPAHAPIAPRRPSSSSRK